ncbi:MAG: dipeptidase [Halobacteriaceae archaeon]
MSFIFDYAAGTPWVITPEVEKRVTEAQETPGTSVIEALQNELRHQFRSNPEFRDKFHQKYISAGVDVASVTISSSDPVSSLFDWQARFDTMPNLKKVITPDDARDVAATDNDIGILLNTQNLGLAIERDLSQIDELFAMGIRIFQLTYNLHNLIGSGCYARSNSRLSNHGVDAVRRLNELGGIIDLSHCGPETTLDTIDTSEAPVAFTHTSCEAIAEHPRAKSDPEIEALASNNGYLGIVCVPWFLAPEKDSPTLDVIIDHLDHAISIMGADKVGLGTDFGNVDTSAPDAYIEEARQRAEELGFPKGYGAGYGKGFGEMKHYEDWPVIVERLEENFTQEKVERILGKNFLSFWERVLNYRNE